MAKAEKSGDLLATTANNALPQVVDMTNFTVKVPVMHNGVETDVFDDVLLFNVSEIGSPIIVKGKPKDGKFYDPFTGDTFRIAGKKFALLSVVSFKGVGSIPSEKICKTETGPNGEMLYEKSATYPKEQCIAWGIFVDDYDINNGKFELKYKAGDSIVGIHFKGAAAKAFMMQTDDFKKKNGFGLSSVARCLVTFGDVDDEKNAIKITYEKQNRTVLVARHKFEKHHDLEFTNLIENFIVFLGENGFTFEPSMELGRNLAKFAKSADEINLQVYASRNKAYANVFMPNLANYNIGKIATIETVMATNAEGKVVEHVYAKMKSGFEDIADSVVYDDEDVI